MAYTSIIPVHRLDNSIKYIQDQEKTVKKDAVSLEGAIDYALNREKTECTVFEDSIGCTCNTAYDDMVQTKEQFHKMGGIQGYHLIQSFAEGEVSPELAHMIGQELAEQLLKGKYEVVITTHLNTRHYHNHLVFNSVSMEDGRKYRSNARSYYEEVRKISDGLCQKYGLSIIRPGNEKGKPYGQWMAEQAGKPTWRTVIREDIREVMKSCFTWRQFISEMEKRGYEWKLDRKYIALRAPGMERYVRLKSLGNNYSETAIRGWILQPKVNQKKFTEDKSFTIGSALSEVLGIKTDIEKSSKRKYTGLQALYYHYLYQMGVLKQKPKYTAYLVRADIRRLDKRIEQMDFLVKHKITTHEELDSYRNTLEKQVLALIHERHKLYRTDRESGRITEITKILKPLRKDIRMCVQVKQHSKELEQRLKKVELIQQRAEEKQQGEKIEQSKKDKGRW